MNAISTYIDTLIQAEAADQSTHKNKHIFYQFLDALEEKIDLNEKMNLMWTFSTVEKGLRECRKGNRKYARFYFDQLDVFATDSSFMPEARHFMTLPGKAFYEYSLAGNFDHAISLLQESIHSINMLVDHSFHFMQLASIEQYLNICRVLFKQKKDIFEFGHLINYMVNDRFNVNHTEINFLKHADDLTADDRIGMLKYVTDAAVFKYYESKINDHSPELLKAIFPFSGEDTGNTDIPYYSQYRSAVRFIHASFEQQPDFLLEELDLQKIEVKNLPRVMQFLFLDRLKSLYSSVFSDDAYTVEHIEKYNRQTLRLGHLYSSEQQNTGYSGSPLSITSEGTLVQI